MNPDPFENVKPQVQRDKRWGRPLIVPPEGGEAVAYTRMTTFAGAPEDGWVLNQWEKHQLMVALAVRPDLILSALAHKDDWGRLMSIVDEAMSTSTGPVRATTGTALHLLCDQADAGTLDLDIVPQPYRADVEKYLELTAGWTWVAHEEFRVWDLYEVAGTADRRGFDPLDGICKIADLKFGRIDSSPQKVSIQLTGYAEGVTYDPVTFQRGPTDDVDKDRAVVIHIPQAENEEAYFGKRASSHKTLGDAAMHYVNLDTGRIGAELANVVRSWRRKQDVFTPYE
jgi:hypothetical protein